MRAEHFHFAPPADRHAVGVAHAQPPRQRLEAHAVHFVQVADAAVDDGADAAQRAMQVLATSPQKAPITRGLSRSCTTTIFGPGTLAT